MDLYRYKAIKNETPKISVLITVYSKDKPSWFKESLSSILDQQSPDQLVLIVDGWVPDALKAIIEDYEKKYPSIVCVVWLKENKGLAHALNVGLKRCEYELVARMDSDDISRNDRLRIQLRYFSEDPGLDILGSPAIDIDDQGRKIKEREVPFSHGEIYQLMWACPLIHPSIMFKKSRILAAGGYSEELKRRQDYELWFRCAELGYRFANTDEPLLEYRVTDDSYKRNSFSVAWTQYKIGLKGVSALKLGLKARLGVFFPVVKAVLPPPLRKLVTRIAKGFDPRSRKYV